MWSKVLASLALTAAVQAKVDVTVYYESLCPFSSSFITGDLTNAVASIPDIMDVTLIPYGNAKTNAVTGEVTCQHGVNECIGNKWADCAIAYYPEFNDHFPFIQCMMASGQKQLSATASCAALANMDYSTLQTCATGAEGAALLVANGEKTGKHEWVPYVLINGVLSQEGDDFIGAVCAAYTGSPKPAACSTIRPAAVIDGEFKKVNYNADVLIQDGITDVIVAHFSKFASVHSKSYPSVAAEEKALINFHASLVRVATSGNPTNGVTKFSDLSPAEFKAMYANRQPRTVAEINATPKYDGTCYACKRFPEHANYDAAAGLDWTTKGAVNAIKDQGQCGSCWAFGTACDLEGTHFLAGYPLISLSEQQLVSCDSKYGDAGCNGGLPNNAFNYLIATGGAVTEADYPYTSGKGSTGTCQTAKTVNRVATMKSFYQVSSGASGESGLAEALEKAGPLVIGIDASAMQDYRSGIDNPTRCKSGYYDLDHAVNIVGYGTENGVAFWKIRNSWGTSWGEKGYYRVVQGKNACGLATDVVHSVVAPKSALRGEPIIIDHLA